MTIPRALCFITSADDVLLLKHAAHSRVFPNRYNGVGGHIERHEDPLTGARREIKEETGLDVRDTTLRAVYNIDAGEATGITLFVFTAVSDSRDVIEDREGSLHWVARADLFGLDLVEDLPILLPRILAMQPSDPPLFVYVSYDAGDVMQMRFAE